MRRNRFCLFGVFAKQKVGVKQAGRQFHSVVFQYGFLQFANSIK